MLLLVIMMGHLLAEGDQFRLKELFERYVESQLVLLSQQGPLKLVSFKVFL